METSNLLDLMQRGGWVMWVLLGFSVLSLAAICERLVVFYRNRTDAGAFLDRLQTALNEPAAEDAGLRFCRTTRGPLAAVARAALLRFSKTQEEIEKVMESAARLELRRLERGLVILATTANLAPLLGFFGTVTGMMVSFHTLGEFQTSNPGLVAQGIEQALTTTAAGLGVAIPVQLAYSMLRSRISQIMSDMESVADVVLERARDRMERAEPIS